MTSKFSREYHNIVVPDFYVSKGDGTMYEFNK